MRISKMRAPKFHNQKQQKTSFRLLPVSTPNTNALYRFLTTSEKQPYQTNSCIVLMIKSIGVLWTVVATVLVPGAAASGPIVNVEWRLLQEGQHHHDHGNNGCNWTKNSPTIIIAQPAPLNSSDRFFLIGQNQLRAVEMMVDYVNRWPRCGVQVGRERYSIALRNFGDSSDMKQMKNTAQHSSFLDSDFS